MANEIVINTFIRAAKGKLELARQVQGLNRDMSGSGYSVGVQTISNVSHEALEVGTDIAAAGYAFFRNVDDDEGNFVEVGVEDGGGTFIPLIKLQPGDVALLPLSTTSVYARAYTGTGSAPVPLEFFVLSA